MMMQARGGFAAERERALKPSTTTTKAKGVFKLTLMFSCLSIRARICSIVNLVLGGEEEEEEEEERGEREKGSKRG